jgi:hypothetical protein
MTALEPQFVVHQLSRRRIRRAPTKIEARMILSRRADERLFVGSCPQAQNCGQA